MDKTLRNFLIAGIIVASLSIGYCLVVKPNKQDNCYNKCQNSGFNDNGCFRICYQNQ